MAGEPDGIEMTTGSRDGVKRPRWRLERGQAMVLIALMMTAMIGFTALAVDAGFAYAQTRQAQTVSDAAALAGAIHLLKSGSDCSNITTTVPAIVAVATKYASNNGYSPTVDSMVAIQVTCPYSLDNMRVKVRLTKQLQSFFAAPVFGGLLIPNVSSVGIVTYTDPPAPFMALATGCSGVSGVYSHGSGSTTVWGGAIHSNSSCSGSPYSIRTSGSGSISSTATINAVGGCDGGHITPACNNGVPVQPDPISSSLTLPCFPLASSGCTDFTNGIGNPAPTPAYSGIVTQTWSGNPTVVLSPGVYAGLEPKNATVWLKPGVYIFKGGGFVWTGNGDVRMCDGGGDDNAGCGPIDQNNKGVMFFNTMYGYSDGWPNCPTTSPANTARAINVSGNGEFELQPPNSGPWKGMGIWQDRCVTTTMTLWGSSKGTSLAGTVYAPTALVQLGGNGTLQSTGTMYAGWFDVSGSGTLQINYSAGGSFNPLVATLLE